jgi:hypothetical protein
MLSVMGLLIAVAVVLAYTALTALVMAGSSAIARRKAQHKARRPITRPYSPRPIHE